MNDNQKIIDLEYRLNYFPGLTSLIKIVQKSNPQISKQEIVDFFEKDITTQLTKKQPKIKPIGHITALSLNEVWQMDIFDLSRYYLFNKHYRYLLACVDVFSRKAYVQPMLNKDDESVKKALITIFKDTKPESILSDHDSSFMSKTVQSYLSSLRIPLNVNALSDHHALGIIDNFALRIKTILTAMFLKNKSTNWINSIQNIVRHYNNRPHSSLNDISPNEATKDTNKEMVFNINIDKKRNIKTVSDLKVGDKVRKNILFQHKLSKGTDPKWSDKVFTVATVHGNTIILNDDAIHKRVNLLKVQDDAIDYGENPIKEAKRITREVNA